MSLKNTKNLLIIGAVLVGLLAGTVLLGNYTNILSAKSDTDSKPTTCQAEASTGCPATIACTAQNANIESTLMASSEAVEKTCPTDGTKGCSAEKGICPKTDCPPDCTKPCCAGDAKPACCPKSDVSAASMGCCPATASTTE